MEKFLAIVALVLFVWLAIPHLIKGVWLAPTPTPPHSWTNAAPYGGGTYNNQVASVSNALPFGFGWFHFDFWNTPPHTGKQASRSDLAVRSPKAEFRK